MYRYDNIYKRVSKNDYKTLLLGVCAICLIICGIIFLQNKKDRSTTNSTSVTPGANNETMIQYFEMYLNNDGTLWNTVSNNASELSDAGFTSIWLPPAYKGDGSKDAGYSAYDLYDLGEFNQKGTVRTKYGTKDEYLAAIDSLHNNNIKVYADIVLDHKSGADTTEVTKAAKVNGSNRNTVTGQLADITSWTVYNFPGRNGQYSSFTWNSKCFDGVDWDQATSSSAVYLFEGKSWDKNVSTENGNYDYLMGSDIDFENTSVVSELKSWGKWYVDFANLDGFRLDAVKHITESFYPDWLADVRKNTGKDLFSVGEYWSGDVNILKKYITATNSSTSLFDVPLHYHLNAAAKANGSYDMTSLFANTLSKENKDLAVTFVDNHDTQIGQSLASEVTAWFKPAAYCVILTRSEGIPCVYYADYYGSTNEKIPSYKSQIDVLMKARSIYAYGEQQDYIDDKDVIGWTRKGDSSHAGSGLAALVSDGAAGSKTMNVGNSHIGESWYDLTGNQSSKIVIDGSGNGNFLVGEKSYSVWVPDGSNNKSVQVDVDVDDSNTQNNPVTTDKTNIVTAKPDATANTVTASPLTAAPNTPAPASGNKVTVYYYSSLKTVNIHYQIGTGEWTEVPGVQMEKLDGNYYRYTIDLGTSSDITCCFNNGSVWDNNNNANYKLNKGTFTIKSKVVKEGAPSL